MKLIGTTDQGGLLYEFTAHEAKLFKLAQDAVKGLWTIECYQAERPVDGVQMDPVFESLALWIRARFAVNALQRVVDECGKVFSDLKPRDAGPPDIIRPKLPCGHTAWQEFGTSEGLYWKCYGCCRVYTREEAAKLIKAAGGNVWLDWELSGEEKRRHDEWNKMLQEEGEQRRLAKENGENWDGVQGSM